LVAKKIHMYRLLLALGVYLSLGAYPWRTGMTGPDSCWTNVTCNRALIVSHGGDWDPVFYPYDSFPAFKKAYEDGSDSVKGDFRVCKDNVGVVMHSSPIEWYESPECVGERVEDMTLAQCTSCPMALTDYKFMSVPDLLSWAAGKVVIMLCVKRPQDIPRAITTIIENNATDRAFLEIKVGDLHWISNATSDWKKVFYVAEGGSLNDLNVMLSTTFDWLLPRIFMFEFDPSHTSWGINLPDTINKLHAKGMRTFTATPKFYPSVATQEAIFNSGIDVVYTYDTQNGVIARTNIDKERGVSPP
jgi:hypothetical protein